MARWDWDSRNNQQYIGIKCGDAWCEIGRPGFFSSPQYVVTDPGLPNLGRVIGVKGWYDQQRLATVSGDTAVPSNIVGTIIPHPELGRDTDVTRFTNAWVEVAYVALSTASDEYRRKYNFAHTPAGRPLNRMLMCYGTKRNCAVDSAALSCPHANQDPRADKAAADGSTWWLKVVSSSGSVDHRCVIRRGHQGPFTIPGTARWRWVARDETTWNRCIQGCCEGT